jgi:outer membrane protein OmpA-like peptidoglycan-associated protein
MRRHFLACAVVSLLNGCAGGSSETIPPTAVVFFQGDSAALDDAAQAIVATAASAARRQDLAVRVLGFATPPGSPGFNRALSDARARNVADGLRAQGVAAERIRVEPHGEVPFAAVPTESRRVEIILVRR